MKEKKNRKFSIILACAAILLVCVMVFLLTGYMRDIRQSQENLSRKQEQLEEISRANDDLKNYIDEDETSRILRSARDNGYVYPDENVYVEK